MAEARLYQTILREIQGLIDSGEFPAGSRLPGERELAQRFGVSRVTIREAEIALETLGIVSIRTGSGVYVQKRPAPASDALPDVSAFELTAARAVIEAEGAALAAARIDDAQVRQLEALVAAMSDGGNEEHAEEVDRQFHLTIAKISGNPVIEYFVQSLWRMRNELPRVQKVYKRVCTNDATARTDEHGAILDALRNREPAAARAAMREHFHRLFEAMLAATETDALEEVRRRVHEDRERFLMTTRV
jgi:GntR family transcriptional repressor for pyruvate dehydrogenase complex